MLGTENELVNFDINTGIASSVDLVYQNRYYRNIHINNIIRKNKNEIWVSTNQGVFVLNEKNKVLSHYAVEESNEFHLPSNNVNTVYADSLGFYFGLDDDLYFISTNKKQKESILASKFLICNKVIDIKKDNKNRIWIATFNGLYLYDQAINTIRAFKAPYFLQNDEFNRRASFVNTDSMTNALFIRKIFF